MTSRRSVWPRGVDRLAASPYAAALVAQHALHIYRRYRDNPGWAPFFTEMETRRDRHHACGRAEREVARAREWGWGHARSVKARSDDLVREYFFLRIGDLVSLTFCNGWTDGQLDDSGSGYAIRLEGTRLTIAPDPFEGRDVHLEITARELPDGTFRSADDARDAWSKAPTSPGARRRVR